MFFRVQLSAARVCRVTAPLAGLMMIVLTAKAQQVPATLTTPSTAKAITLNEAIDRAWTNEPKFAAAVAAGKNAALDKSIARAALLPNAVLNNQFIYTQPNHCPNTNKICLENSAGGGVTTPAPVRFIANNAVHEYSSQASVTETIGAQQFNALSKASVSLAVARAELEVSRRGLVVTVAGLFYSASVSNRKVQVAQRAANEAADLTKLTQQREAEREVAHADVVKAQLQQLQRDRDLKDALLQSEKARLELGVLLFADPRTDYALAVPDLPASVPARADVEAALQKRNPELESALASSRLADLNVIGAWAGYLPELQLNYSYGIDAAQFATHAYDGSENLGYSIAATLNIPIWDWFTTRDKVRQSVNSRVAARAALTNAQRKVIADLEESYAEAVGAHDQLDSLNQSVTTAAESLRLTRLSYGAGEAKILDVVDAENSLTTAENAREDGMVRYQAALANLQLLTGTL